MSLDNTETASKPSVSSDDSKKASMKKNAKAGRHSTVKLPAIVVLSYEIPVILILIINFVVIGFSYSAGADWVTILIRAIVSTVVIGGLAAIIAYIVSAAALVEFKDRLEQENEKEKEKVEEQEEAFEPHQPNSEAVRV